jgi:hypothetical protein
MPQVYPAAALSFALFSLTLLYHLAQYAKSVLLLSEYDTDTATATATDTHTAIDTATATDTHTAIDTATHTGSGSGSGSGGGDGRWREWAELYRHPLDVHA